MYSYGPPHMAEKKQDEHLEHTYSSYVRIRDVALKTCQRRRTIGRNGKRGSGISVLAVRHDDIYINFHMHKTQCDFINLFIKEYVCLNVYITIKNVCIYIHIAQHHSAVGASSTSTKLGFLMKIKLSSRAMI